MLVVEGWLTDDQLEQAVAWAESNGVRRIIATGGPIRLGSFLTEWGTYAEMTLARLEALGMSDRFVLAAVPSPRVRRGRTRASAQALRERWDNGEGAFNLASGGPHTRRSWRSFKAVFHPDVKVGSVVLRPEEYGADDWWRCSEGVREVLGEAIAYTYDLIPGGRTRP